MFDLPSRTYPTTCTNTFRIFSRVSPWNFHQNSFMSFLRNSTTDSSVIRTIHSSRKSTRYEFHQKCFQWHLLKIIRSGFLQKLLKEFCRKSSTCTFRKLSEDSFINYSRNSIINFRGNSFRNSLWDSCINLSTDSNKKYSMDFFLSCSMDSSRRSVL